MAKETTPKVKKVAKEKTPKAKKVICGHFTYRFLKQEISGKGVVPTLIENLLKARKDLSKPVAVKSKSGAVSQSSPIDVPQARDKKGETQLDKLDRVINLLIQVNKHSKSIDEHLQNPTGNKNEDLGDTSY
jgi:hypothetical protein